MSAPLVLGVGAAGAVAAVTTQPSATLLEVIVALLGGGLFTVLFQIYMRWRKGPIDDALQMQHAADVARRASEGLFTSYRVELEDAKKQLSEYLDQLVKVNRDLGAAEQRIQKLERDLHAAHGEARDLRAALTEALARRDQLVVEVGQLRDRIIELETVTGVHEPDGAAGA